MLRLISAKQGVLDLIAEKNMGTDSQRTAKVQLVLGYNPETGGLGIFKLAANGDRTYIRNIRTGGELKEISNETVKGEDFAQKIKIGGRHFFQDLNIPTKTQGLVGQDSYLSPFFRKSYKFLWIDSSFLNMRKDLFLGFLC
jgi:hypothetical protein